MAKNKTIPTEVSVTDFVNNFVGTEEKRKESFALIKLMQEFTGFKAVMWGASIIGFGLYHYKYNSGHEGDAPMLGFSPRKRAISLYVFTGLKEHLPLLKNLGKFKMGKVCIYVKKLSDINLEQLKKIMGATMEFLKANYQTN